MPIDVGVVWVDFLAKKSGADLSAELELSKRYLEDYRCGRFQVEPFMRFHMQLLARFSRQNIEYLRERFVSEVIKPNVMPAAVSLVESMRESGYTLPLESESSVRVGVLTSNFHVLRAKAIARNIGFTNVGSVSVPSDPVLFLHLCVRECFAVLKDQFVGNM